MINVNEELKELLSQDNRYKYMMLDRLIQDCKYYLGYGNRCSKHLWAKDEHKQIELIKGLYNSFSEDEKPNFITMEDIKYYKKQMCDKEYIKEMLENKLKDIDLEYNKNNWRINQKEISYAEYEAIEERLKKQYEYIENQLKSIL